MDQILKATNFAAIAHKNQRRKNTDKTPYINHPIETMYILSQCGVTDPNILCAAVLHDTVEDCGITYDNLCRHFGETIANLVMECTDDKSLPKVERKRLQIEHAKSISVGAKLIKAADKLSNCLDLNYDPPINWCDEVINGYMIWSYAVWLQLKGHNDALDGKLNELFTRRCINGLSDEQLQVALDKYYGMIDKLE